MIGDKRRHDSSINTFPIKRAHMRPFAIGPLHLADLKNAKLDCYAGGLASLADEGQHSAHSETSMVGAMDRSLADIRNEPVSRSRKISILDIPGVTVDLWGNE